MSSILVVEDSKWAHHRIKLYSIWSKIQEETLWQGFRQKKVPCNGILFDDGDDFVEYYIDLMKRWSWHRKFSIRLNYRDKWKKIYKSDEWFFEEIE